jgi:WS/DGAT/MGAT family acyltransferase
MPEPEPGTVALIRDAAVEIAHRPIALTDATRAAARDVRATAARASAVFGGVVAAGRALLRSTIPSALHAGPGQHRRLAVARTTLDAYREVRAAFDGTVNDVVLAVVAGALRSWLLGRSTLLQRATTVRALVPVTVRVDADGSGLARTGRHAAVRPLLVDLPVGEPDPVLRLAQLRYAMAIHKASGRAISAEQLTRWRGLAAPTLHALGARAANGLARRMFDVAVTNVPGPQVPLYAAGARMSEMFPILPLSPGQALSVALTSYDGGVYYGLNGDRDAVADIAVLAELIEESLGELVAVARARRRSRSVGWVRRS